MPTTMLNAYLQSKIGYNFILAEKNLSVANSSLERSKGPALTPDTSAMTEMSRCNTGE